jgi:YcaO-like protein with predicted kinase domain
MIFRKSEVCRSPVIENFEQTDVLRKALNLASACGITRITEITRLDIIGIPVVSVARPLSRSVTVHTGKGMTLCAARISAVLEAVEYAYAEQVDVDRAIMMSPGTAYCEFGVAIGDFCPSIGSAIDSDLDVGWLMSKELFGERAIPVPMESIYMPCPTPFATGFIRPSTVGMACGSSFEDAAFHGLCEVVERHVNSFDMFAATSRPVPIQLLTGNASLLAERILEAGISIALRSQRSFGLHYVDALVWDIVNPDPRFTNMGMACHTDFQAAAQGALLEAIQSRLTFIHGGRDDLQDLSHRTDSLGSDERAEIARKNVQVYCSGKPLEPGDISSEITGCVSERLRAVTDRIRREFPHVLYHSYSKAESDIHVLRVVIPGMEQYMPITRRMGRRLYGFLTGSEAVPATQDSQ